MLWAFCVVLLVLWTVGMVSSHLLGGFLHVLLVVALAVMVLRVRQGRSAA